MTKEEIKNYVIEHKECCKKLAEEYRQRYNEDNTDKLALNMFYHNVISYNDYESVLALFENRNSMIMCFSAPPVLTEETVEINLKRIAELEKEIRCECTRCVYSDSPCIRSDYGVEKDEDVCPNYKNVFVAYSQLKEENVALKELIEDMYDAIPSSHSDYYKDVMERAEQFISEVEK